MGVRLLPLSLSILALQLNLPCGNVHGACLNVALVVGDVESIETEVFQAIVNDSNVLDQNAVLFKFDGNTEELRRNLIAFDASLMLSAISTVSSRYKVA
jgi:hypothetical protein